VSVSVAIAFFGFPYGTAVADLASVDPILVDPSRAPVGERDYIVGFFDRIPSEIEPGATYHGATVLWTDADLVFAVVRAEPASLFEAQVRTDDRVRYYEWDNPMAAFLRLVPNDSLYGNSGHWGSKKIGAETAWDRTLGSTSVKVQMMDSGLVKTHEEFAGSGRVLQGYDFVNNDNDPNDEGGACGYHGTHTTGTAGATINNAKGIAGMSQHTILPVKAFYVSGIYCTSSTTTLVNALKYAGDQGAHIASNSWGSSAASAAMNDAVQYSHDRGVTHVAAAGNSGPCTNCVSYPWRDKASVVIVVSSTTSSDGFSSFSSEGPQVDVSAPGSDILSACGPNTNSYCTMSGTSMATPHVAGTAALLKTLNPSWGFTDIENRLRNTALDLGAAGFDNKFGYGRIRADAATAPATSVPSAPSLSASAGNLQVSLSWTTPSDGGSPITGYRLYRGTTSGSLSLYASLGVTTSYTDTSVTNGVTYYYQVSAVNAVGEGPRSNQVSATPSCPGPSNNCFGSPISATGSPYSNTQSTSGADLEAGEPRPCGSIGATVWYSWTAPAAGTATVSTVGGSTNYDTVVAAYTGSSLGSLANLACNDDTGGGLQSQISFTCTSGTTYRIQLGGYNGATGTATLSISGCQAATAVLDEKFDGGTGTPAGWTFSGLWRVGSTCAGAVSSPNSLQYNQASTCNYATGSRTTGNADTPAMNLNNIASPKLTFDTKYVKENYSGGAYDILRVQVQVSGSTSWTTLWQRDSRNADQTAWGPVEIGLSSYKSSGTKVRFFFDSVDGTANNYLGWAIDNVKVQ